MSNRFSLGKMKSIDTTTGPIGKQLILFTIPLLISNFLQQLYSTIDMVILGNYGTDKALAATGTTVALTNILLGLFVGISTGASVVVAQAYGAHDNKKVYRAVHSTIFLGFASGALLMIIGLIFAPNLLELIDVPEELLGLSTIYMRVTFAGMIPLGVYNMSSAILRAIGDSTRPLIFLIISSVINIILDLVFVAGFKLNILGAALATVIAQTISAGLALYVLTHANDVYRVYWRDIKFYKESSKKIIAIGLPAGIQSAVISGSNTIIQARVNSFGANAIEGYAAANKIDGYFFMCVNSFSISATTFVGQNIGANKYKRAKKGIKIDLGLGIGISILLALILGIFRVPLLSIFNIAQASYKYGLFMVIMDCFTYWIFAIGDVLSGAYRGAGKSIFPMVAALINMFVIRIIWVNLVAKIHPSFGLTLLAYPISWTFQALTMIVYYFSAKWLRDKNIEAFEAKLAAKEEETEFIMNVLAADEKAQKQGLKRYKDPNVYIDEDIDQSIYVDIDK